MVDVEDEALKSEALRASAPPPTLARRGYDDRLSLLCHYLLLIVLRVPHGSDISLTRTGSAALVSCI